MRTSLIVAVVIALAAAVPTAGSPQAPPAPAASAPAAQPAVPPLRTFRLGLDKGDEWLLDRSHAEFELDMRQFIWQDPMVRLQIGVARELWRQQRGGLVMGPPAFISANLALRSGVNPRLILAGPFASDWQELTPQERIGRIAESATYAGLIIGLLSWLGKR